MSTLTQVVSGSGVCDNYISTAHLSGVNTLVTKKLLLFNAFFFGSTVGHPMITFLHPVYSERNSINIQKE